MPTVRRGERVGVRVRYDKFIFPPTFNNSYETESTSITSASDVERPTVNCHPIPNYLPHQDVAPLTRLPDKHVLHKLAPGTEFEIIERVPGKDGSPRYRLRQRHTFTPNVNLPITSGSSDGSTRIRSTPSSSEDSSSRSHLSVNSNIGPNSPLPYWQQDWGDRCLSVCVENILDFVSPRALEEFENKLFNDPYLDYPADMTYGQWNRQKDDIRRAQAQAASAYVKIHRNTHIEVVIETSDRETLHLAEDGEIFTGVVERRTHPEITQPSITPPQTPTTPGFKPPTPSSSRYTMIARAAFNDPESSVAPSSYSSTGSRTMSEDEKIGIHGHFSGIIPGSEDEEDDMESSSEERVKLDTEAAVELGIQNGFKEVTATAPSVEANFLIPEDLSDSEPVYLAPTTFKRTFETCTAPHETTTAPRKKVRFSVTEPEEGEASSSEHFVSSEEASIQTSTLNHQAFTNDEKTTSVGLANVKMEEADLVPTSTSDSDSDGLAYELGAIIDHKIVKGDLYLRVQWVGFPPEDLTWLKESDFEDELEEALRKYKREHNLGSEANGTAEGVLSVSSTGSFP